MESNHCVACEGDFDHSVKQRIMIPCGDSICSQCFEIFLQPGNKLECLKCGVTSDIIDRSKQKAMELKGNIENIQTIGIFCEIHSTFLAEKYCTKDHYLICRVCLEKDGHRHHPQSVKETNRYDIQHFCDNAVAHLVTLRDRINTLVDNLNTYKSIEKCFTAGQIMDMVSRAYDILTKSFLKTDQEQQNFAFLAESKNAFDYSFPKYKEQKHNIQDKPYLKVIENPFPALDYGFNAYSRDMFDITPEKQDLLQEWIGRRPVKFQLAYRGTRDGFDKSSFHSQCQVIKPTLILIKSDYNQVFGGFTSIKWHPYKICNAEPTAFIFSLTKKMKLRQFQNQDFAISYGEWNDWIIQFGTSDIIISDKCDRFVLGTSSEIGGTYEPVEGHKYSQECKTYLAGGHHFKVIEMEAYECI